MSVANATNGTDGTAKSRAPWMQFWGDDFMAATLGWSAAERGAYLILLWAAWQGDGLPADTERVFRLDPDIRAAWAILEPKFPVGSDGRRRNQRQESERAKADKFLRDKAAAGRASAAARQQQANSRSTPVATEEPTEPQHEVNHSLSLSLSLSPSPSQSLETHTLNGCAVEPVSVKIETDQIRTKRKPMPLGALERLWSLFPRKVGKKKSLVFLERAIRDYAEEWELDGLEDAVEVMRERIDAMAKQYRTTEPQFIPHPATWLGQGRYLDPMPEETR